MSIRMVQALVQVKGSKFKYVTDDGFESFDLEEAVEHENSLKELKPKPVVVYEQIWTIQQAINMAVAENRVVRFLWKGDNASIKKGIEDLKGCKLMKPDRDSKDIAVVPEGIEDFDFDEVDTSLEVKSE